MAQLTRTEIIELIAGKIRITKISEVIHSHEYIANSKVLTEAVLEALQEADILTLSVPEIDHHCGYEKCCGDILVSCPFCGFPAKYWEKGFGEHWHRIMCSKDEFGCDHQPIVKDYFGPTGDIPFSEERKRKSAGELFKLWNRRAKTAVYQCAKPKE